MTKFVYLSLLLLPLACSENKPAVAPTAPQPVSAATPAVTPVEPAAGGELVPEFVVQGRYNEEPSVFEQDGAYVFHAHIVDMTVQPALEEGIGQLNLTGWPVLDPKTAWQGGPTFALLSPKHEGCFFTRLQHRINNGTKETLVYTFQLTDACRDQLEEMKTGGFEMLYQNIDVKNRAKARAVSYRVVGNKP